MHFCKWLLDSSALPILSTCLSVPRGAWPRGALRKCRNDAGQGTSKGRPRTTAGRYSAVRAVGKGAISLSLLLSEARISPPWLRIPACVRGVGQFLQIKAYSGGHHVQQIPLPHPCPHPTLPPGGLRGSWKEQSAVVQGL